MSYKLQFVQMFKENGRAQFLALERKFAKLEETEPGFYKGKRYVSYAGQFPNNTFIWEREFDTLEEAVLALKTLKENDSHEELFAQQNEYFLESYTNIFQSVCND